MVVFTQGVHHDPNAHVNPHVFDPSRFGENSATHEQRSPFTFIPFSVGLRNCIGKILLYSEDAPSMILIDIGQRFAYLNERVIVSTLLRQFSFRSTQTIDELGLSAEVVLRTQNPIQMIVEERHCSTNNED